MVCVVCVCGVCCLCVCVWCVCGVVCVCVWKHADEASVIHGSAALEEQSWTLEQVQVYTGISSFRPVFRSIETLFSSQLCVWMLFTPR